MDHTMNGGSAVAFFCFSLRIQPFYPFQIVVLVEGEIEGRVSIASRAFVYTNAIFALQNACWAVPNPLHSAPFRCRLRVFSKRFYNKKDSLGLSHEGRVLGYRRSTGFRFFSPVLFFCKEQFYVSPRCLLYTSPSPRD